MKVKFHSEFSHEESIFCALFLVDRDSAVSTRKEPFSTAPHVGNYHFEIS